MRIAPRESVVEESVLRFEQLAIAELDAAQRSLSCQDRLRHEHQAYLFALRAHSLDVGPQVPASAP